jgi:DNA-binding transcriptional LysR family regulator
MALNLHLLRIFFAVAEQRSFSRAAETLFISQPAVSRAVRELEHQVDLTLIERGGGGTKGRRGIRLTESGQALYEHARAIFAMERAATEDIRARVGLKRGTLAIGASTTVAGYWLPAYVARFVREFPAIRPQVVVGNTQTITAALIDCRIDFGLVEGPVDDNRISSERWRNEALLLVAATQSPLARRRRINAAELSVQPWLMREVGSGTREVATRLLLSLGVEPTQTIELGSNEGIARAVASGSGIAVLPAIVVQDLIELGRIKMLRGAHVAPMSRVLYRLELKGRPLSPSAAAFSTMLAAPPAGH